VSRSRSRWPAAGLGLLLLAALLEPAAPAAADDTAPVVDIVAPVLDISLGEADLRQAARVEKTPKRTRITLDSTVLFARDSPKINAKARDRLDEVGEQLKDSGAGAVSITGYTDDLGSAAHGLTLSRQRATSVADVLRQDLPASSYPFTVRGRGEADPAVPNTSEHNRRINRRVVIVFTKR
jgi:outer membrane protein OmpA-like peptidoglycan-associated protein